MTENPAQKDRHTNKTEDTGNGWAGVGWRRRSLASENSVLRKEYRREDQYLISIEIQPMLMLARVPVGRSCLCARPDVDRVAGAYKRDGWMTAFMHVCMYVQCSG